jgi:hypothetical protein
MLLVLLACAVIGLVTALLVTSVFGKDPVTKAQIEQTVAKRPKQGKVQVVLCNEEVIPSQNPQPDPPHTWTCDTYLGPNKADAQNGPSYEVVVSHDRDHIQSIRQVPTH